MRVDQDRIRFLDQPNLNYLWAAILVEELRRQGVQYFFLAPGSRCAPLAAAVGRNRDIIATVHFDERSLAFMACGYCAGSGKAAVLICTSGTAAANFLPAVIEASKKKLPLIILTADRPPELQKTGAPQTIEQSQMYSPYVRWSFDFPCPTEDILPQFILTTAAQLMSRTKGELPGPVHLNLMFRLPVSPEEDGSDTAAYSALIQDWADSGQCYSQYFYNTSTFAQSSVDEIVARIDRITNGVILCGKLSSASEQELIIAFAEKTGFPIFADITSGLRLCKKSGNIISYYDYLILNKRIQPHFDGVIHFGGRMTSQRCHDLLASLKLKEYLMVIQHPLRSDPLHKVTARFIAKPSLFINALLPVLSCKKDSAILSSLKSEDLLADKAMDQQILAGGLSERAAVRLLSQIIPDGHGVFLSNSMPVRLMDTFASAGGNSLIVGANRGASGIDGIISSAIGFAQGINQMTTLIIGDLAFLCDINGLSLLSAIPSKIIIIVFNNNGGQIFSTLPIASDKEVLEKFFIVPHGLSFSAIAQTFNIRFSLPTTIEDFKTFYLAALKSDQSTVIEINSSMRL